MPAIDTGRRRRPPRRTRWRLFCVFCTAIQYCSTVLRIRVGRQRDQTKHASPKAECETRIDSIVMLTCCTFTPAHPLPNYSQVLRTVRNSTVLWSSVFFGCQNISRPLIRVFRLSLRSHTAQSPHTSSQQDTAHSTIGQRFDASGAPRSTINHGRRTYTGTRGWSQQ